MKRKVGFVATVGALVAALTLALAACGGDGGSEGVASLTNTTGQSTTNGAQGSGSQDWQEAQLAYARCMRAHGVDFPDPVNGRFEYRQERGGEAKYQAAHNACKHILEDATPPPLDEEEQAEQREAQLAFARCMREHGVDYPDPQFEDGGSLQRVPEGTEDDPQFEEAQQACQPILDDAQTDGTSAQGEGT